MSYHIEMVSVSSSVIRATGYDGGTRVIEFHSGRTYEYHGVPYSVYAGLINASSPGRFYTENIRGRFQ